MNFGFVINNDRCIGCHACSTACKSENEVPVGVQRTWVKYTETGRYPDVTRHFQVTRCNHCANPPCVRICPVSAMYQRDDGIVEFNGDTCIGCKACIQACPYDAIYIDPNTGSAAKCHFCAHRTDIGLEPACVVVCPEHAILAGDLDDPNSEISRVVAKEKVTVRKPEQGTAPKLFYVGGHAAALHPTSTSGSGDMMYADASTPPIDGSRGEHRSSQGLPSGGAFQIGAKVSEHMVQVAYNASHRLYWHWPVPAYIVTKSVASGLLLLFALFFGTGAFELTYGLATVMVGGSLLFQGATAGLLVFDLEKPAKFLSILTRPQWQSWLARGAYILVVLTFGSLVLLAGLLRQMGSLDHFYLPLNNNVLVLGTAWVLAPVAVLAAIYTAFLFNQAEGRDLWQHPLLPMHMLVRSFLAGLAFLLVIDAVSVHLISRDLGLLIAVLFLLTVVSEATLTLIGDFSMSPTTDQAGIARRLMHTGKMKFAFWCGYLGVGRFLPVLFAPFYVLGPMQVLAGACAILGIFIGEYLFCIAAQKVPNS